MNLYCAFVVVSVQLAVILAVNGNTEEQGMERCHMGDTSCIKDAANLILRERSHGVEELNLVDLNPLSTGEIVIRGSKGGMVDVDVRFSKSFITGLQNVYVESISGFGEDMVGPHVVKLQSDSNSLVGDYVISGSVLYVPIWGSGKSNMTFYNPRYTLTFHGEPKERDGKAYMSFHDFKVDFSLSRLYIRASNLFNNGFLSDNMNRQLNANWQIIYSELKQPISNEISRVFRKLLDGVFQNEPYNELFLPDSV
ncbi:to.2 family protein [Megaselia abdita]